MLMANEIVGECRPGYSASFQADIAISLMILEVRYNKSPSSDKASYSDKISLV